ncbi:MAG: F0F1 ATP synthase subunit B [Candidatus Peregrinibacteria bacterium]|nr:F0F1 ATP synthase subunit B [Candidatus Peregrinibacteria bacterium]
MEIISTLGIDPKLILAQVVNFLILFFVLKKLVYKPVVALLEKRRTMVEQSVLNSKKIEERLAALEDERKKILAEASSNAMAAMEQAKKDASEEHQKAMVTAKKEISALAERYRGQLKDEKDQMFDELKAEVATLIVNSCEKILRKEFGKEDQRRLETAIKNEINSK